MSAGRRIVTWFDSITATRVVKIMALTALVVSIYASVGQYRLTACVARYNERSNVSQRARAEAAETDRQAQDVLFRAIADDPRHAIDRIRAYNESRATADAQRASNPVPAPPSETCG